MPRETMARLLALEIPTQFIYGNGDKAILAQLTASDPSEVTYWGTTEGVDVPEPMRELIRWTARQVPEYREVLASWPLTTTLSIDGLGTVLFCHATPRNEIEIFTRLTPEERLLPVFAGVDASLVVCGHTHMQFDRMVGPLRVVNAGSVGMPFGTTGADWLLLGPESTCGRPTTTRPRPPSNSAARRTRWSRSSPSATSCSRRRRKRSSRRGDSRS